MPIEFLCPQCTRQLRVPDGSEGRQAKCPDCQAICIIPGEKPRSATQEALASVSHPAPAPPGTTVEEDDQLKETTYRKPGPPRAEPVQPPEPTAASFANPPAKVIVPPSDMTLEGGHSGVGSVGTTTNPFQAPTVPSHGAGFETFETAHGLVLASRWHRFLGKFVDYILTTAMGLAVTTVLGIIVGLTIRDNAGDVAAGLIGASFYGALLIVPIINWVLITKSGQTLGKKLVGTRIVMERDGALPGFAAGVVLRSWLPSLLGVIPFFGLVDVLWIFGEKHQCVHDLIASTRVVEASSTRPLQGF